jgi:hypothetical protein
MPGRLVGFTTVAFLLLVGTAAADITPTRLASDLSAAIDNTGGAVTGASFVELPPGTVVHSPAARSDTALELFPTHGADYAILTNGRPDGAIAPAPFR